MSRESPSRSQHPRRHGLLWAALGILSLSMSGCGGWSCRWHHAAVARPGTDAFDRVKRASFRGGSISGRGERPLPPGSYPVMWFTKQATPGPPPPIQDKIHPRLRATLGTTPPTQILTVLVTLRDTVRMPPFPLATAKPMTATDESLRVVRARALADSLKGVRAVLYAADSVLFVNRYGAQVLRTYWLTHALLLKLQNRFVDSVAFRPDVASIRAARAGERPPEVSCSISDSPCAARNSIRSDPYVDAQLGAGRIALLDTGVRKPHKILGRVSDCYDCVNGDEHCEPDAAIPGYNPADECPYGHGTSSAGILTGDAKLGTDFAGVTNAEVKSYKVYARETGTSCKMELDAPAVLSAFQEAVIRGADVILAEVDADEPPEGDIAGAADGAFGAGVVVIAANGNALARAAGSPAVARRVVGAGAFSLNTGKPVGGWSGGETWDHRMKPDLLAPTDTRTADNSSDIGLSGFSGTSGDAPYLAGSALLVRNLLAGEDGSADPGQVNAFLILAGHEPAPFTPRHGAGNIVLPIDCTVFWGKVQLAQGESVQIPIDTDGLGSRTLEAGICWPDAPVASPGGGKSQVEMFVLDQNGGMSCSSTAANTVFQRATSATSGLTGTWKLKLHGANVPTEPQDVYWAVAIR